MTAFRAQPRGNFKAGFCARDGVAQPDLPLQFETAWVHSAHYSLSRDRRETDANEAVCLSAKFHNISYATLTYCRKIEMS
jgi:hypothetical protein